MTQKERLLTLLAGETPDCVPWYADLSHWFVVERGERFVPTSAATRDTEMVDLHTRLGAGLYLNMGAFLETAYDDDGVSEDTSVDGDIFRWTISTPVGSVVEERRWSETSFSWDITHRMIQSVDDFRIIRYAMEARRYVPRYERYYEWEELLGDIGVAFAVGGFCGLGFLVSRFMGVIETMYAIHDCPAQTSGLIETINETQLKQVDVLAGSPSPVVLWTDNLDANTQPPPLFRRYSQDFYTEMARRCHANGKKLSIHVDGSLNGMLSLMTECGVDIADAVTPAPMGDISVEECREQAGQDLVLWGGIPPNVWEERWTDAQFDDVVKRWLDLRLAGPQVVLAPGDQVPPGTPIRRIERAAELAESHGRY